MSSPNPDENEGLAIALARIAEEKDRLTGFLDLGRLGLTGLPEELFELKHLSGLNLGSYWVGGENRLQKADSKLAPNDVAEDLGRLEVLSQLSSLFLVSTKLSDLKPIANLTALNLLDCSGTQVSDLKPIANLTTLSSLYCNHTQVSDLKPIANLTALRSLYCASTQVSDLKPIANLTALSSLNCS